MDLDGVELILAIEKAFQIHIEDEEAGSVSTVGDLQSIVISKLQGQDSKCCMTSAAFYRVRRSIIDALGVDRRQVRPGTPLEVILPEDHRRENWQRIQDAMNLELPRLQHPRSISLMLLALGVALTVGPGIYGQLGAGALTLLLLLGLVVGGSLIKLSPALAVSFPHHSGTVGDLSRDVMAINHAQLVAEIGTWSERDVSEALRRLIVTQTGVAPEQITLEAHIVNDLGIN